MERPDVPPQEPRRLARPLASQPRPEITPQEWRLANAVEAGAVAVEELRDAINHASRALRLRAAANGTMLLIAALMLGGIGGILTVAIVEGLKR